MNEITGNLLEGRRTSHSMFKLPESLLETLVSSMRSYAEQGIYLRVFCDYLGRGMKALNAWMPKNVLSVVDKLLKNVTSNVVARV